MKIEKQKIFIGENGVNDNKTSITSLRGCLHSAVHKVKERKIYNQTLLGSGAEWPKDQA